MIRCKKVDPTTNQSARDTLDLLQMVCMPDDEKCEYKPGDLWWIAFDDAAPVGYACTRPTRGDPATWYLARAAILRECRGRGLQKRLIRLRLRGAKAAGATLMVTDTRRDNHASSNSLIACGFRLYEPAYKWGFETGLYWKKPL